MNPTEVAFITELLTLLNKYQAKLIEYEDIDRPEMGFITNFESLKVKGPNLDIDLFRLKQKFLDAF